MMNFEIPKTVATPLTIAIIGGGFSGSMIAAHLLRAQQPLCVKLIERRPEAGRGIAYSTSLAAHLLNVPAGKMSAFPDRPTHFLEWLQHRWFPNQDPQQSPLLPDADSFVPRMVYGDYIRAILNDAIATADPVRFERITDEAVAVEPVGQGACVRLKAGGSIYADRVVLATGNFPASLPVAAAHLSQSSQPIREAWSWDALTHLQPADPVLLVGTGLTMVDMVIALQQRGHRGPIYAVSRHGLLPQSHQMPACPTSSQTSAWVTQNPETLPKTARSLLRLIRREIAARQDWQAVIDGFRPITQTLWQTLPLVEQQRFLRHGKAYWETHRHRIAPEVSAILTELRQTGQLVYYAGRIEGCRSTDRSIEVTLRQRGSHQTITLNVQRLINCTGTTGNYDRIQHPLIASLRDQQLICPSPLGLGIETAETGAVINAQSQVSSWLYTLGTSRRGSLWETTAVPELRQQAQDLAQTLLESLPSPAIVPCDSPATALSGEMYSSLAEPLLLFRQLFDRESCTYTYLIGSAGYAILVDPVLEQVERDRQVLQELGLKLYACLETHIHADHITGAGQLRQLTDCQVIVPAPANVEGADRRIRDGEVLQLGTVQIRAIATPGHTDSHMAYLVNQTHLLTGDSLLIRGCGRTDFQGGDAQQLYQVVTQTLFTLPDSTWVYPGHDYQGRTVTTIGEEKRWNPRFACRDPIEFAERMSRLNLPAPKKLKQAVPANQRCGMASMPAQSEISEIADPASTDVSTNLSLFYGMYI